MRTIIALPGGCVLMFGQNAAEDSLRRRLEGMKLSGIRPVKPQILLTNNRPADTVPGLGAGERATHKPQVRVPAPACDPKLFQNR